MVLFIRFGFRIKWLFLFCYHIMKLNTLFTVVTTMLNEQYDQRRRRQRRLRWRRSKESKRKYIDQMLDSTIQVVPFCFVGRFSFSLVLQPKCNYKITNSSKLFSFNSHAIRMLHNDLTNSFQFGITYFIHCFLLSVTLFTKQWFREIKWVEKRNFENKKSKKRNKLSISPFSTIKTTLFSLNIHNWLTVKSVRRKCFDSITCILHTRFFSTLFALSFYAQTRTVLLSLSFALFVTHRQAHTHTPCACVCSDWGVRETVSKKLACCYTFQLNEFWNMHNHAYTFDLSLGIPCALLRCLYCECGGTHVIRQTHMSFPCSSYSTYLTTIVAFGTEIFGIGTQNRRRFFWNVFHSDWY